MQRRIHLPSGLLTKMCQAPARPVDEITDHRKATGERCGAPSISLSMLILLHISHLALEMGNSEEGLGCHRWQKGLWADSGFDKS